jgi:hypothetical protein
MHKGYIDIIGKQFMINEEGYYFDFIINNIEKNYFTSIDKLNKDDIQVIKYPKYEELMENLNEIINSNSLILLFKTQKKEIELISTYFKKIDTPFNTTIVTDFLELSPVSIDEIFKQAKTNNLFRFIYVFLKIKHMFNLNTSKLYKINKNNMNFSFVKSDFSSIDKNQFPNAYLFYSKSLGHFNLDIFFNLLFYDLVNYSDEKINYLLKLIKFDDFSRIDVNKLGVSEEIIKQYSKEIAWIKKDDTIFMIGGLS